MKIARTAPFVLLFGCIVGETDSYTNGVPTCDITVDATWPLQDAMDFYYRDTFEFNLSAPDPDARIIFGMPGTQTVEENGLKIVFTPQSPLTPNTDYEVALDYCYGSPTIAFSTSDLGEPIDNPASVLGRTYEVDLREARFIDNPGVADFLTSWLDRTLLFQVTDYNDGEIALRMAIADLYGAQDVCYRSFDIDGISIADTDLHVVFDEILFEFYTGSLEFNDFSLLGTLSPDLEILGGAEFSGVMNISNFTEALSLGEDENICDIVSALNSVCEPCPYNEAESCVWISGDRLTAVAVDIDLEDIEERDSHPDCEIEEEDIEN